MDVRHCVTEMQHKGNLAHVAVPLGAAAEPACSHHTSVWSGSGNFATLRPQAPPAQGLLDPTFRPSSAGVQSFGARESRLEAPQPLRSSIGGPGGGTAEEASLLLRNLSAPTVLPHVSASPPTAPLHCAPSAGHASMPAGASRQQQAGACTAAPFHLHGPEAAGVPGPQVVHDSSRGTAAAGSRTASLSFRGPPQGSPLNFRVEPVCWKPASFASFAQSPDAVPQPLTGQSIAGAAEGGSKSSSPTPSLADPQFAPYLQEMLSWQ